LTVQTEGTLLYHWNTVNRGKAKVNQKILSGKNKERRAISPIIATLLLILIAIAAGVVVYAYVIGFVGSNTSNTGATTSVLQIENFCASINTHCTGSNVYSIVIQNTGSTSFPTGTFQIYFTDITASGQPNGVVSTCSTSNIAPGSSVTCAGTTWTGIMTAPSSGDTMSVKVVAPDGGTATLSTKVIS
jgi:archaeal type IV pilus assembly protein PilA